MDKIYVVGGEQKKNVYFKNEWNQYKKAVIACIDVDSGNAFKCVEYVSPVDKCPDNDPSIVFKSGTLIGNSLYVPTQTELLIYELKSFQLTGYISLPCFNDVHHVSVSNQDTLLVANTGLDMILELDSEGSMINEWSVAGCDIWQRFCKKTDYRKVGTTKPHKSHPNFVFQLENEIWATRFIQRDAICVTNPSKRISIDVGNCHDGVVYEDGIYFTCTDGKIIIIDRENLKVKKVHDLNLTNRRKELNLGWCRGLERVSDDLVIVGFSRLRPTKIVENIMWVRGQLNLKDYIGKMPTRIVAYNLKTQKSEWEFNLEDIGLHTLFSVHLA